MTALWPALHPSWYRCVPSARHIINYRSPKYQQPKAMRTGAAGLGEACKADDNPAKNYEVGQVN